MKLSFYKRILKHLKRDSIASLKERSNTVILPNDPDSPVGLRVDLHSYSEVPMYGKNVIELKVKSK